MHFQFKEIDRLKKRETERDRLEIKGWKKRSQAHTRIQKAKQDILMPDKIDLKMRSAAQNKEGNFTMSKSRCSRKAQESCM